MLLWIRSRTIEGCPTCLSFVRVNTKHDWSDTFCALEHHRPRYSLSFVDPRVARHQQHQQKHTLHTWHISAIIPHPSPQPTSRRCGPTCPSVIVPLALFHTAGSLTFLRLASHTVVDRRRPRTSLLDRRSCSWTQQLCTYGARL